MFEKLKNKLVSMITAGLSLEQQVFGYEETNLTGDPAITITPSANSGEYSTNQENARVYAFTGRVWVDRTARGDAKSEQVAVELVDSMIDLLDRYYTLGSGSPGTALSVPTGYTVIRTEAAPAAWFYVDREKTYRLAEIAIRVHVRVDVEQISQ